MSAIFKPGLESFIYKGKKHMVVDATKNKPLVEELISIGADLFVKAIVAVVSSDAVSPSPRKPARKKAAAPVTAKPSAGNVSAGKQPNKKNK